MKLGFDVDGVLADFNEAFVRRVVAITGRNLFPTWPFDILTWDYPQHFGYTAEETNAVWNSVMGDPTFWSSLSPYWDAMTVLEKLRVMSLDHAIYFVTSRPGLQTKQQSELWLATHSGDFMWNPTVLISSDKGTVAHALKLDAYIDDKWENCLDVATQTRPYGNRPLSETNKPLTKTYLLDRPWNRAAHHNEQAYFITRVESVEEMVFVESDPTIERTAA